MGSMFLELMGLIWIWEGLGKRFGESGNVSVPEGCPIAHRSTVEVLGGWNVN
jgi:hypothetical protein